MLEAVIRLLEDSWEWESCDLRGSWPEKLGELDGSLKIPDWP